MLKKFFVSLLILSALTTEAIAACSASFGMYLYPSSLLGTAHGEGVLLNGIEEAGRGKAVLSPALSGSIKKLTLNIEKLKIKSTATGLVLLYLNDYLPSGFSAAFLPAATGAGRNSAFQKSGLSPPFLLVSC
jgi:hypothetical protein